MQPYLVTYAVASDPENMVFDNKVQYFLCDATGGADAIAQLDRHAKNASVLMVYLCTPVA